ncbi:hypothetical protein Tco_0960953 [Tanacetum coccineum]
MLQILWGVVNRAHIDYAERMWEEFTQSIHTFIDDKNKLAQHTQGKNKATLLLIPGCLGVLQAHQPSLYQQHKFQPETSSPPSFPNKESCSGYHQVSAKGTKREVFGMPIPNDLITDDIREIMILLHLTLNKLQTQSNKKSKPSDPKQHQTQKPLQSPRPPVSKTNLHLPSTPLGKETKAGTEISPRYDKTTGNYSCQLDEQWFDLTKDTLRDALQITPVDNNNAFTSPPTPDALIKFVNDLGYPKVVRTLSDVMTNDMFLSRRKTHNNHNLCLTGKTSGFERTKALMLQILWGHKFHPRLGSPLHLPNEESVLGYLKFSAKGTKREVFGMPIPNDLITDDIRGEQYYNAYLEKVAKHQRYLAGEEVSDPDSPVPKLNKATKHKLIDEFVDEGVPKNEPRLDDEEAAMEPNFGKFQLLPEVQGKGKEKVSDEQVALDLLTLQTPKKKSPTEQYIFQRRTSTLTESSSHDESSLLYAELGLTISETESDEEVSGIVARVQDEGQAGPNPSEHDEGQAGPNLGDAATSQPLLIHVVHAGPNLEHVDLEASDTLIQPNPEQMDEEFTTMAYPNVQENLKLSTEGKEDKPEKTNIEAEVQSMVMVPIHQDTLSVPIMTTLDIDLTVSQPVPTMVQAPLPTLTTTATATTTTTTTTLPLPPQPQ